MIYFCTVVNQLHAITTELSTLMMILTSDLVWTHEHSMEANWPILKTTLDGFSHYGDVGISVMSPTGEVWSRQGDLQFPTASITKILIMITVYRMIDQNRLALANENVLKDRDK